MRDIKKMGRFGNQLFIYCFCKGYAEKMGFEFQCPDWIGRKIFANATEPLCAITTLPQTEKRNLPIDHWFGRGDMDVNDYCQSQCYLNFYSRAKIREWLKLKPEYESWTKRPNAPYSAAHMRRGDYLTTYSHSYCAVSEKSYKQAIEKFNIPEPIVWVSEETALPSTVFEVLDDGAWGEYARTDWMTDFLMLRDADYLLRANSSFSWWAAALGCGKVYAPIVGAKVGIQDVEFTEGNWPCTAGYFPNQSNLFLKEI